MWGLAGLGAAALLAGCGSSPPKHFYLLEAVDARAEPPSNPGAAPVQVAAVRIPPALDRQEMVCASAPNLVTISDTHRWGAPLGAMVRDVLTQDLVRRLPADAVILSQAGTAPGAYRLAVDILEFGCDASGAIAFDGGWSAYIDGSDVPVVTRHLSLRERAAPSDYGEQAGAMSRIVGRLADDIARELRTAPAPATRSAGR
jgi:uncharacterized lipoprotein YmbA